MKAMSPSLKQMLEKLTQKYRGNQRNFICLTQTYESGHSPPLLKKYVLFVLPALSCIHMVKVQVHSVVFKMHFELQKSFSCQPKHITLIKICIIKGDRFMKLSASVWNHVRSQSTFNTLCFTEYCCISILNALSNAFNNQTSF